MARIVSSNKWSFTWWNFTLSSGIDISIIAPQESSGRAWDLFYRDLCKSQAGGMVSRQSLWSCGAGLWCWSCCTGTNLLAVTTGEPLDFSLYSPLPPLTCPDVLDRNLCTAKAVFYHVAVKCQSLLVNLSTPVVGMIIPIINAKPDHLAAIMVMSCSVTVGHSVQLLLWLILYWKRPLFSFRLSLCGLKIEKAYSSATCPRYRGWKEAHNPKSIIHSGTLWYSATIKSLVSPPKQVMITSPKRSSSEITESMPTSCPDNMLCPQRVWTLLLLSFKHLRIMAGLWLDGKPLHLPVASCSGSCNVIQCSRELGCPPCSSHSTCCWWIAAFLVCVHTADSPVLWDWDIARAESHKIKQNIN